MRKPIISAGIAMLVATLTAIGSCGALGPLGEIAGAPGTVGRRIDRRTNHRQRRRACWTEPRLKNAKLFTDCLSFRQPAPRSAAPVPTDGEGLAN